MIDIFTKDITITEELSDILSSVKHKNLVINAYAGTGKTTTLKMIAESNPKKKILYLVFNKAMEVEAKKKFGKNVSITTVHSLAYRHMSYKLDLSNKLGNISVYDIKNYLNIDYFEAKIVWILLNIYLQSDIFDIDENLIDLATRDRRILHAFLYSRFGSVLISKSVSISSLLYKYMIENDLIGNVKAVWDAIGRYLPITHDYYLKRFQLDLVTGKVKVKNYDYIFLDEAQDSNEVTYSIFKNINSESIKVAVGDQFQNIYGFRGSMNIMDMLEKEDNFEKKYLSISYRFTNDIANMLNKKIKYYTNIDTNIKGMCQYSKPARFAYIARSNSGLIPFMERLPDFYITRDINEIFD
ncbi:MAG: UvrD-helicase domain-containing protein, partial [Candidatus Methanomethylicia archaeon]